MENKILSLKEKFEAELSKIENTAELENMRVAYLGKKGSVTDLLKGMKELSNEEKKAFGQKVNELKGIVADKIAEKTNELKEKEIERETQCLSLTFQCLQILTEAHIILSLLFKERLSVYLSQWALLLRITARL